MVGITSVLLRPKCLGTPEAHGLGMCPALRLFTVHKLRGPTPEPCQEIKCRFAKVVACYDDRDRPGADTSNKRGGDLKNKTNRTTLLDLCEEDEVENFVLPILISSFWSLIGCLFVRFFLNFGYHRLLLLFLMNFFGGALLGRVLILDLFPFPQNMYLSSTVAILPVISSLTWPETESERFAVNQRLPVLFAGYFLLLTNILCTAMFREMIQDHAVVPGITFIAIVVGVQIFLMLWAIYFIKLAKSMSRGSS